MSIFDDPTKETLWTDIEGALTREEPGWIAGELFMVNNLKTKHLIVVKSGKMQLRVSISCPGYDRLELRPCQKLKIALKGAVVKQYKTSTPGALQLIVMFESGVTIQFDNNELVDLWQIDEQDWFSTPPEQNNPQTFREEGVLSPSLPRKSEYSHRKASPTSSTSCTTPASTPPPHTPQPPEHDLQEPTFSSSNDSEEREGAEVLSRREPKQKKGTGSPDADDGVEGRDADGSDEEHDEDESATQKHAGKKRKKRDTRHDPTRDSKRRRFSAQVESRVEPLGPDRSNKPSMNSTKVKLSKGEKKRRQIGYVCAATNSVPPPSPPKRNPALDLVAGCSAENGAYPALSEIDSSKVNSFTQIIGVVARVEPIKMTRTGELSISVTLVDPSNFQSSLGFKVTCFMKAAHERFLPEPSIGHVLLLKSIKISNWQGNINGTIYPDKLRWVAFNPDTGKFYHKEDAAISAKAPATGLNASFNPFHHPMEKEVKYFVYMGEWWRAVQEEQEKGAIQIQDYSRKTRAHALVGDMSPNVFFDATVEVVMRSDKQELQDTLFLLSDFTPHSSRSTEGPFGQWAVSAYTSMIHAEILEQMKVGTIWAMKNVRLKTSSNGSIEFDLYAVKLRELSLDDDEEDIHLKALLERRKEYIKEHPFELNDGPQGSAPLTLVSDISTPGRYAFIAEMVYRSYQNGSSEVTDIYVTDFTNNELLSQYMPEGLKRRLKGEPVLRIAYFGDADDVRNLEDGAVYKFEEVRIATERDGGFKGYAKKADLTIKKISLRRSSDPDVAGFLKRKEAFLSGQITCEPVKEHKTMLPPSLPYIKENAHCEQEIVKTRHQDQPRTLIRNIRVCDKCPNKFRVKARVVDFWPLNLEDFTQRRCKSCKTRIPDNRYACTMCDDMEQKLVQWVYHFALRLEDEEGDVIDVAICDEGKYFLSGLPPSDLTEGDNLNKLRSRLAGLLGNLVDVHEGLKRREGVEPNYGPYQDFAMKSWRIGVGRETIMTYAITGSQIKC